MTPEMGAGSCFGTSYVGHINAESQQPVSQYRIVASASFDNTGHYHKSCTCFSKMDRTLTAIDGNLLEARLLLQIHREHTTQIETVINRFATVASRRLNCVL